MHADLVKLLDLQSKDAAIDEVDRLLRALQAEVSVLDQAVQRARDSLDGARRAAADGVRRRDELEAKVDSYRILQDRRVQRLETVRNPKEASTLMAELELARSVMAKEETEWVRSAEAVTGARAQGGRGGEQGGRGGSRAGARARAARGAAARPRRRARSSRARAGAERRPDRQAAPHPVRPPAALAGAATSSCRSPATPAAPATPPSR